MHREVCSLCRKLPSTGVAQHVLKLSVPGNAVCILLLEQQCLAVDAVDYHLVVVINHCQLSAAAAEVQAPAFQQICCFTSVAAEIATVDQVCTQHSHAMLKQLL